MKHRDGSLKVERPWKSGLSQELVSNGDIYEPGNVTGKGKGGSCSKN